MGAAAWVDAVRRLGGDPVAAATGGAELERRWGEPHRRYHTGAHLQAVLRDSAQLAAEVGLSDDERAVVALAACAHDIVYDARPGLDEAASAEWARRQIVTCRVASAVVDRVVALVLATTAHSAADDDLAAAVLLDADLAILGSAPDDYLRYVAAVRAEYATVPEPEWRRGRAEVLARLLARDPLYRTGPARRRWEAAARRNMTTELRRLAP